MGVNSAQDRIRDLDARVRKLEGVTAAPSAWKKAVASLALDEDQAVNRVLGWMILTLSALGLMSNIGNESMLFLLTISGSVGLWLVVQASGLIDESDSARILAQEERPRRARKAGAIHRETAVSKHSAPLAGMQRAGIAGGFFIVVAALTYGFTSISSDSNAAVLLLLLVFAAAAVAAVRKGLSRRLKYLLVAACFVMLFFLPSVQLGIAGSLALSVAGLIYAWEERDEALRAWVAAAGLYFTQIMFVPAPGEWTGASEAVRLVAGLALSACLVLPYVLRRRSLGDRDVSRASLTLGAVGLIATILAGSLYAIDGAWPLAFATAGFVCAGFAYFAWNAHQRLSYAKYLLTLSLASWLACFYLAFDSQTSTLLLLISGILAVAAGFSVPSYTSRLVGLAAIGAATFNYLMVMMPEPSSYSGSVLLSERVWTGLVLALFLPALGRWYSLADLRGSERLLVPTIALGSYAVSFLVLFGIISLEIAAPLQTFLWIILGCVTFAFGYRLKLLLLKVLGGGLAVVSVLKLLLSDVPAFDRQDQMLFFLSVGLLAVLAGMLAPRYFRR